MKKLLLGICAALAFALAGCRALVKQTNAPILALSTYIDVTFYNVDNYQEHYKEIKKIYQSVDRVANDFESNPSRNSVYDLNNARALELNPLLIDMIKTSVELMDETNGYFNPFIGRLSHLWKDAMEKKVVLDSATIENELKIMKATSIKIEGNNVTLVGDGNLDLGGIAKGYATELCQNYLKEHNIKGYLINAGNSNIICGEKGKDSFTIGISDPDTGKLIDTISGTNLSIATSSYEHQRVEIDGTIYHHIISPFTGYPVNNMSSISIKGTSPLKGDVYSTALFLMDVDKIKELAIEVIIIKGEKVIYNSIQGVE